MQTITPFLWFNDQAEEAARFYVSIFKNSGIQQIVRYGETGPGPAGTVMTVSFQLDGQQFVALNGGPVFNFTEAVSFVVNCETQAEIDTVWGQLAAGGIQSRCGWLKDRYGLSWQVVPTRLAKMLADPDRERSNRVMKAMLQMDKIDLGGLEQAFRRR